MQERFLLIRRCASTAHRRLRAIWLAILCECVLSTVGPATHVYWSLLASHGDLIGLRVACASLVDPESPLQRQCFAVRSHPQAQQVAESAPPPSRPADPQQVASTEPKRNGCECPLGEGGTESNSARAGRPSGTRCRGPKRSAPGRRPAGGVVVGSCLGETQVNQGLPQAASVDDPRVAFGQARGAWPLHSRFPRQALLRLVWLRAAPFATAPFCLSVACFVPVMSVSCPWRSRNSRLHVWHPAGRFGRGLEDRRLEVQNPSPKESRKSRGFLAHFACVPGRLRNGQPTCP